MRAAAHAREAARSRGVAWSGLDPGPFGRRSSEALLRDACALHDALAARRESPAGRLSVALAKAQAAARDAHSAAEALRGALARGEIGELPLGPLSAAAEALMDAARLAALSGGACATNTASSRPSTTSPRNSAS
ncbi:hypothetical protein [Phenylobacterium sp.]|uniref:hypothetical protein n=1 Tax=Phenylobacterium sp. TaxID=1871053 RepID=UPI002F9544B3